MDPISVGLLVALAGGAGGEAGRQAWAGLTDLVRRPLRRGGGDAGATTISSGERELHLLAEDPGDITRASALSTALAVRAALDEDFNTGLQQWREVARLVRAGDGDTHNTVSGGTFNGPVLQGRDFSSNSFDVGPSSSDSTARDSS